MTVDQYQWEHLPCDLNSEPKRHGSPPSVQDPEPRNMKQGRLFWPIYSRERPDSSPPGSATEHKIERIRLNK